MNLKDQILDVVLGSPEVWQIAVNVNDEEFRKFVEDTTKDIDNIVSKIDKINNELIDNF